MRFVFRLVLSACLSFLAVPALAQPWVLGTAYVVDGDTVEIHGISYNLNLIDAPERGETCLDRAGLPFDCGERAAEGLRELIADRPLMCIPGPTAPDGLRLAECDAGDGDIGARMLQRGYARTSVKISTKYAQYEVLARKAAQGLWGGWFDPLPNGSFHPIRQPKETQH